MELQQRRKIVSKKGKLLQRRREHMGISRRQMKKDIDGIFYQDIINIEKWGDKHPVAVKIQEKHTKKFNSIEKYLSMREQIRKGKVI